MIHIAAYLGTLTSNQKRPLMAYLHGERFEDIGARAPWIVYNHPEEGGVGMTAQGMRAAAQRGALRLIKEMVRRGDLIL